MAGGELSSSYEDIPQNVALWFLSNVGQILTPRAFIFLCTVKVLALGRGEWMVRRMQMEHPGIILCIGEMQTQVWYLESE